MNIDTFNKEDTYEIGFKIGKNAKPGQIYCLEGDLGVGKTIFAKGFAKGLDIEEIINSPTFTIVNEYHEGRLPLYHFDVYRIMHIDEMQDIGFDEYINSDGVCIIEWAGLIKDILPSNCIKVEILKDNDKGFNYRKLIIDNEFLGISEGVEK